MAATKVVAAAALAVMCIHATFSPVDAAYKTYVYATNLRQDLRRCASPMCGGLFYTEVNAPAGAAQKYIAGISFDSKLDASIVDLANSYIDQLFTGTGKAANLVLAGKQEPISAPFDGEWLNLVVDKVYIGLPNVPAPVNSTYFTAKNERLTKLNTASTYYYSRAVKPDLTVPVTTGDGYLQQDFLIKRIASGSAIVAGSIAKSTFQLIVQQIFLALPDPVPQSSCKSKTVTCKADQLELYKRDADRCIQSLRCVKNNIACALYIAVCSEGYNLASWTSESGCPAYACDPSFLEPSVLPQ